ncbi:MAG: hypothetical protein ABIO55_02120 [Ginsengibacter sp.]
MRKFILILTIAIISCKESSNKKARTINQSSRPVAEIKDLVVNMGDSNAYYSLFYHYVDTNEQNTDMFYYSYMMAFKYNYPKAYIDVFDILCNMYNISTGEENIKLNRMDEKSKQLALECLKRASELNYLDSKHLYQVISSLNK